MKERDDTPNEVVVAEPLAPAPITAAGLAELRERLAVATDPNERARLERYIDAALVTDPPEDRDVVGFGATVKVEGAAPKPRLFTIVGDIEANPTAGKVGVTSPLAEALLGAHVGDSVVWHRPAGDRTVTVRSITYETPRGQSD